MNVYVITNRRFDASKTGIDQLTEVPSEKGPNELRLVHITRSRGNYRVELLDDRLTRDEVRRLKDEFKLDIDVNAEWYASLTVACRLFRRATRENKHLLLLVHGYNNDVEDILKTVREIEQTYDVIVVPFSWPANGGGAVGGKLAYLDDKRDARASSDALDRVIGKLDQYYRLLTEAQRTRLLNKAVAEHPGNPTLQRAYFAELLDRHCKTTVNLLCHSMGNYVFKYAIKPSGTHSRNLVFDNVVLAAADANNKEHARWLMQVQTRKRLYVTINENDYALNWSRMKPGKEQLPRLGHYIRGLDATNAHYINLTDASWVQKTHTYFIDKPVKRNEELRNMFTNMFTGRTADDLLRYRQEGNYYELKA